MLQLQPPANLETVKDKAKRFYLADITLVNICKMLSIKPQTLNAWVHGDDGTDTDPDCWYVAKHSVADEMIVAATIERLNHSLACTGTASAILLRSLQDLNLAVTKGGRTLTVKEMESVASIVEKLDKLVRLEKGSPTEIIAKAGLSVEEARSILKTDPFAFGIVEVDSTPVVEDNPLD